MQQPFPARQHPTLNPYNLTKLRRGYNKVGLWVVFHVARDKVRVTRKHGASADAKRPCIQK